MTTGPYNFYRTSGDTINAIERVYANVHTLVPFLGTIPLSKPGAWAYADGMEIGRITGPYAAAIDRTIFGWYVITSSPLSLGHNVSNDTTNDRVWPVVSNTEVCVCGELTYCLWKRSCHGLGNDLQTLVPLDRTMKNPNY